VRRSVASCSAWSSTGPDQPIANASSLSHDQRRAPPVVDQLDLSVQTLCSQSPIVRPGMSARPMGRCHRAEVGFCDTGVRRMVSGCLRTSLLAVRPGCD
jgi:hypothetical protein